MKGRIIVIGFAVAFSLLALPPGADTQESKPAVEYESLLNLRFYEPTGGFLVDGLKMVFPPPAAQPITFTIARASGETVAEVPLRLEPMGDFPAFARLLPKWVPGSIVVGKTGDFVMSVKVGAQVVTSMQFSLKEERSTDPFNPKSRFVREGPWDDIAFLSVPMDDPTAHVAFNWWMSLRELPAGTARPLCTIHFMQGAREVAASRSPVVPSTHDWQFLSGEVVVGKTPRAEYLTMQELTKRDGAFTVVVKVNAKPVKSYRFQVNGGRVQGLDRSRLDYEPHSGFISPRYIDTSAGTTSRYKMKEAYWIVRSSG